MQATGTPNQHHLLHKLIILAALILLINHLHYLWQARGKQPMPNRDHLVIHGLMNAVSKRKRPISLYTVLPKTKNGPN